MRSVMLPWLVAILLLPAAVANAQTGKIAGQVTDAESGNPLPGVNVVIQGTTMGATTDADGYYSIINIDPDTYTLRATFVGYASTVVEGVEVDIDLTTTVNFELQEETVGLDEVVVTSETPVVQPDISGSQANIDPEEVEASSFHNVNEVLGAQAGVRNVGAYDDTPAIRGSGLSESNFVVDGVSQRDPISNRPHYSVNLDAVQQIKVQTGGFSAEHGNIRSGMISVVTKEGGQEYSGSVDVKYSPPGIKHFGPMMYGFDSPVVKPFVSEEAGAFSGNNFFPGWNAVANESLKPGESHYGKPMELYARYLWRHRSADAIAELKRLKREGLVDIEWGAEGEPQPFHQYGDIPDYQTSLTFGGPIPLLPSTNFFISYKGEQTEYNSQIGHQDAFKDRQLRAKVTTKPVQDVKLTLTYFNNVQDGASGWSGPGPTGFISRNPFNQLNWVNKLWYPNCGAPGQQFRNTGSAKITHTLSENTYYELQVTHKRLDHKIFREREKRETAPIPGSGGTTSSNRNHMEEGRIGTAARADSLAAAGEEGWENWRDWAKVSIGGYWYDEGPEGYGPVNWRDVTGEYRMESCVLRLNNTYNRVWSAKGSLTSQVDRHNQIKAGFQIDRMRTYVYEEFIDPSVNAGNIKNFDVTPWQGAFYAQDKLEFEGLVANVGLRADWILHGKYPVLDGDRDDKVSGPYSDFLLPGNSENLEEKIPLKRVKDVRFSPRLGISHPISTVAKIFFNYGHFYQWPDKYKSYLQRRNVSRGYRVSRFGNPRLEPPRTIAYEIGYEHNLFNRMSLRATGYYKDINGEIDEVDYHFLAGGEYETFQNMEFRDVRGLEAQLNLRRGSVPYFSGWASLDYMVESRGGFGYDDFFEDRKRQPDEVSSQVSNPDVRPLAKLNLDFHTPDDMGPQMGGFSPLGGLNVNLLYTWQRGRQFTWNPENYPLVEDNVRWKPYQRWDLRLRKSLYRSGNFESIFYVDIKNLFNQRNLQFPSGYGGWAWDWHKWWNNEFRTYMESLDLKVQEDGTVVGDDQPGEWKADYIDLPAFTPRSFLEKRDIYFGVKLRF